MVNSEFNCVQDFPAFFIFYPSFQWGGVCSESHCQGLRALLSSGLVVVICSSAPSAGDDHASHGLWALPPLTVLLSDSNNGPFRVGQQALLRPLLSPCLGATGNPMMLSCAPWGTSHRSFPGSPGWHSSLSCCSPPRRPQDKAFSTHI